MTQPRRRNSHETLVFSVNGGGENRLPGEQAEVLILDAAATC
jgi:hypothetical protein